MKLLADTASWQAWAGMFISIGTLLLIAAVLYVLAKSVRRTIVDNSALLIVVEHEMRETRQSIEKQAGSVGRLADAVRLAIQADVSRGSRGDGDGSDEFRARIEARHED